MLARFLRKSWIVSRRGLATTTVYETKRLEAEKRLLDIEEVKQRDSFAAFLARDLPIGKKQASNDLVSPKDAELILKAGFATFLLHVEGRIASYIGEGFYTIGPCGEELMGVLGLLAKDTDPMALHYRHVAVQVARQMQRRSLEDIILDRARAYVCSTLDPVTGGHHCAIGGGKYDFYVTSTLASQAPSALGRALGIKLGANLLPPENRKFPSDSVSIVSVGDGSVHNGMFLSTLNMSKYASFRGFKCPLLFVITNNDLCISLRGYGYLAHFVETSGIPTFKVSGRGNVATFCEVTGKALEQVRKESKPAILVVDEVPRRFGHAATDRQTMYLSDDEIRQAAATNPLEAACTEFLSSGLVDSPKTMLKWWNEIQAMVEKAFIKASQEPKITTREEVLKTNKPECVPVLAAKSTNINDMTKKKKKPQPMRVLMNEVLKETMSTMPEAVYVGEDVRHGGYYRVTDDLAKLFPNRVQDIPPDETSVLGIGIGYAQAGLLPIVEIPYAKYLDCGADVFYEAALTHWCTNGNQKDGFIIRLQGFDKGVFGGNFHTHNSVYLPPGLDVVCYSNGRDYVRGMRYALYQAKHAGRIVMSVDSTDLLHRRDLFEDMDGLWLHSYPEEDMLDFETVVVYDPKAENPLASSTDIRDESDCKNIDWSAIDHIIFSYGNGIPTSLRAAIAGTGTTLVVDCPTLGHVGSGLHAILQQLDGVKTKLIFADVCKAGQHPFGATIFELQEELKRFDWSCVAASPTYNPLGCTVTFLNEKDITNYMKNK